MCKEVGLYGKLKDITRTSHHVNQCWEVYLCSMNKGLEKEILNMLIQLHLTSIQDRDCALSKKKMPTGHISPDFAKYIKFTHGFVHLK